MVKGIQKSKKTQLILQQLNLKSLNNRIIRKIQNKDNTSDILTSKNLQKVASQSTQKFDGSLYECIQNVLNGLKIDTYIKAIQQFNRLYDYVNASITFGQYQICKQCSVDQLQKMLFSIFMKH